MQIKDAADPAVNGGNSRVNIWLSLGTRHSPADDSHQFSAVDQGTARVSVAHSLPHLRKSAHRSVCYFIHIRCAQHGLANCIRDGHQIDPLQSVRVVVQNLKRGTKNSFKSLSLSSLLSFNTHRCHSPSHGHCILIVLHKVGTDPNGLNLFREGNTARSHHYSDVV